VSFDPFEIDEFAVAGSMIGPIVERTARYGLSLAVSSPQEFERWLLIWSADVAGELGEVYATELPGLEEVGDVLWGATAVALLLGIPVADLFDDSPFEDLAAPISSPFDVILAGLRLLEITKKICRDGQEVRPIDRMAIESILRSIVQYLGRHHSLVDALNAVESKLLRRYPNGFTPEASVNRAARTPSTPTSSTPTPVATMIYFVPKGT
jgi:hypothetical protein